MDLSLRDVTHRGSRPPKSSFIILRFSRLGLEYLFVDLREKSRRLCESMIGECELKQKYQARQTNNVMRLSLWRICPRVAQNAVDCRDSPTSCHLTTLPLDLDMTAKKRETS